MKKTFLITEVFCFSTFFLSQAMSEPELKSVYQEKIATIDSSRYEGFPNKCDFESHPERFIACPFCRTPLPKESDSMHSVCCNECFNVVEPILAKTLTTTKRFRESFILHKGTFSYFIKAEEEVSKKFIKSFIDIMTHCAVFRHAEEPRRFYLGGKYLENGNFLHIWTQRKLTIEPEDRKIVENEHEAETYVKYICEKYNIFGPETGTPTLEFVPADSLTYEEIVKQ